MIVFDYNFLELQQYLGKRPGDKFVDPYYLRKSGTGVDKPYFWNNYTKKWERINPGDKFYFDDNGIPVRERA